MVVASFRCSVAVAVFVRWCGTNYIIITITGLYRRYYTIHTFSLEEGSHLENSLCVYASIGAYRNLKTLFIIGSFLLFFSIDGIVVLGTNRTGYYNGEISWYQGY